MFGTIDKLYGGICTMKWDKYTIETTTEAEDYISCTLADLGIEGIRRIRALVMSAFIWKPVRITAKN